MKTILVILLASICGYCIAQNDTEMLPTPTNLMDLPIELLLMIYKNFELKQLIRVAKTHPQNRRAAEFIFKDNFSKLKFEIKTSFYGNVIGSVSSTQNYSEHLDIDYLLETIYYFGHLIPKLFIEYRYRAKSPAEVKSVQYEINKYMSKSLNELHLTCKDNQTCMNGLQGLFTAVETLHLIKVDDYYLDLDINLSEMFPAIRRMRFYRLDLIKQNIFQHNFPHLEYMELQPEVEKYSIPVLLDTFKLNPQLRHLKLGRADRLILELVSEYLPNIERLDINMFFVDGIEKDIHFNNLKMFEIEYITMLERNTTRIPLIFGNLEECIFPGDVTHKMIDIIVENKKLKNITITKDLNEGVIDGLTGELPNLEEISICRFPSYFLNNVEIENFIINLQSFLNEANKLKKVSIFFISRNIASAIKDQLIPEWKAMTDKNYEKLILTRN